MSNNILVLAVHPDDETLGAGGTLLQHKQKGDKIHWLIVTAMKEENGFSADQIKKRNAEIQKVAQKYKFDSVTELNLATTKLDQLSDSFLVGEISKVFKAVVPHTVYLPFAFDVHSDHRKVFECAFSCTKVFRYPSVKRVLMMEALSETEFSLPLAESSFIPNVYVDITQNIEAKLDILQSYDGEIKAAPFPRSVHAVKGLAAYRGSVAGVMHAEAFMLIREII